MSVSRVNSAALRRQMVHGQLVARGIHDTRVLQAMGKIPREVFVPDEFQSDAYGDWPLPIGFGQTISQPYTVACMCEALQLVGSEKVLDVGTGSGYAAAILAELAQSVYSVERIPELAELARLRCHALGIGNLHVVCADGTLGLPEYAPYDAIIVAAGSQELPAPFHKQLADGGRIVIPLGPADSQNLYRFTRHGESLQSENLGKFVFVPLIGKYGWPVTRD